MVGWDYGQAKTARVGLQQSRKLGERTREVEKEEAQGRRGVEHPQGSNSG